MVLRGEDGEEEEKEEEEEEHTQTNRSGHLAAPTVPPLNCTDNWANFLPFGHLCKQCRAKVAASLPVFLCASVCVCADSQLPTER